ncbi:hypothetical protein SAMN05421781_0519 [Marinococcus luteus]|uniref:DUF4352 domain-containing protein n=1 Tax=Marinococcus luteus TaxID=1122204 RepID=A0A1H2QYQ3_9BACI|nr:hypothetical protein [Marinococcus luteus]SDW12225.1 hypothetical protein SAMN05421781_0519 [Marinococcus luteus]
MKKYLLATGIASLTLVATACGSEESSDDGEESSSSEESSEGEPSGEESSDESNNEESDDNSDSSDTEEASAGDVENQEGDTVENEAGTFEVVKRVDDAASVETGPINLDIDEAKVIQGELNSEYQEILERESAEISYIQFDLTAENTEEAPVDFYATEGTITTNTGEQLESDMFFGEPIDGMFLDAVTQTGNSIYILENSTAEEIESATLRIGAPVNEDFEDVGESVEEEIDFTGGN